MTVHVDAIIVLPEFRFAQHTACRHPVLGSAWHMLLFLVVLIGLSLCHIQHHCNCSLLYACMWWLSCSPT
jgi:hypothetical protein